MKYVLLFVETEQFTSALAGMSPSEGTTHRQHVPRGELHQR